MNTQKSLVLLDPALLKPALAAAFTKLKPSVQWHNPVMFVVYIGSILTTLLGVLALQSGDGTAPFVLSVAVWLWFTVLFANFAEALAEGRAQAQASSLRGLKKSTMAKKLTKPVQGRFAAGPPQGETAPLGGSVVRAATSVGATFSWLPEAAENLRKGDVVLVEAHDLVPLDGEVIEGVASVDESAITGESAPVVRESGGDFSSVTGGTRVLSDWLVVRIGVNPGESFLDRMISMVEGAKRQKDRQQDRRDHRQTEGRFADAAQLRLLRNHILTQFG